MTAGPAPEGAPTENARYAFRYELPGAFVHVRDPIRLDGWQEAAVELLPGADEAERTAYARQMLRTLPTLLVAEETLVDVAVCLGVEDGDDGYRLSQGLLAVCARPSRHGDRLLAAEGIYRAKEQTFFSGERDLTEIDLPRAKGRQGSKDTLLAVHLPCGPGVMSASVRAVTRAGIAASMQDGDAPPAGSPAMVPETVSLAALQLIIPAPRDYVVYVTISTPCVDLLTEYTERLSAIGRTFSFDDPDDPDEGDGRDEAAGAAAQRSARAVTGGGH
ncbi:hypothetical protein [Streptomyces sp. MAR4 CNX-425]|uniref:hypothetical protein n=1 Tax=Streptomyces sp. MAR4 CNX-425 TaxID=3406343 RepID=UPI003B50A10F